MRAILVLLLGCCTAVLHAAPPAPKLHFEKVVHDFGDIPRKGGDVECRFRFRNDGTAPLVLTRVVTSCTCTKARFPRRPVAPGEEGEIVIVYEARKKESGVFSKVIRVYSNTPGNRNLITIRGNAYEEPAGQ